MIQIPAHQLSQSAAAMLVRYQQQVNIESNFASRVALALKKFEQRNRPHNKTFQHVKQSLTQMCSGARRCMYCEDSVADEVEHHKPKNLYPDEVFSWENFLYACGPCNGFKGTHFAIFNTGEFIELRNRETPQMPPPAGITALLDPRHENPLDFMMLDIAGGTFLFVPVPGQNPENMRRTRYSIDTLKLNERDYLPRARRAAYSAYLALLRDYINHRNQSQEVQRILSAHRDLQHATVWQEMKRQRDAIPALRDLFLNAPEALDW